MQIAAAVAAVNGLVLVTRDLADVMDVAGLRTASGWKPTGDGGGGVA